MEKARLLLLLMLAACHFNASAQVSFGAAQQMNDEWKFVLADIRNGASVGLNDSKWQTVALPHDWSVKGHLSPTLASCMGYLPGGIGWYRKTLHIPIEQKGKKVYLYFEGVYNRSEVFVNGAAVGKRPNGYVSFLYDITPQIQYGKDNLVAVRVDHSQSADSRWYTGSGIYRNVWLVYADPVHIAQWGVYAYPKNVTKAKATLDVETEMENGSSSAATLTVRHELISPTGKTVASSSGKTQVAAGEKKKLSASLQAKDPLLWSIEQPNLYQLKTTIIKENKVVDQTITRTGFRSFTFDPDKGFALNDRWMKVKGVCLHHDAGVLGSAVPREVWERRLMTLKEIGCNAIRTSHNPQAPDLYDLCDELGLLVLNEAFDEWEFAKRKWLEGWNVGTPGHQGSFDFFNEWGESDLADMVRRDRNHLSVFAWSIGNEVDYPNDPYSHPVLDGKGSGGFTQPIFGGYKKDAPDAMRLGDIAKRLVAIVKQYDRSRPVTAGLAGVAMSNETAYPGALDITGYNYTESRYAQDHARYPKRIIYGSENRHELSAWQAVTGNEHIFGQFLWTGIDYLGESGPWPSRGFYSGLLDFGGFIKPRGHFRQALWASQPVIYAGTYPTRGKNQMKDVWSQLEAKNNRSFEERVPSMDAWPVWNYEDGQLIRVVSYTNAAKARLELNGRTVGETKDYNNRTGIIFWDIPYEKGKLEAVALDKDGKEIARYAIYSSKQPFALSIQSIDKSVDKNKGVSHVVVQVVDEDGVPVMLSDNEISCLIDGPGKLLGLEASNNEDMSDYTDNVHRAYHGRLLAYIQSTGEAGEIKLRFTSPWLKPVEASISLQ